MLPLMVVWLRCERDMHPSYCIVVRMVLLTTVCALCAGYSIAACGNTRFGARTGSPYACQNK